MTETRAKIYEIADQLLREGVRPTQQNVRERLGSGSLTTINRALNEWWSLLGKRFQDNQAGNDIPEPVVRLSQRLWSEALGYAEREYRELRESEIQASETGRTLLAQEQLKYASQVSDLNNTIVKQRRLSDDLSTRLAQQASSLLEAQEQCYRLTLELEDSKRLNARRAESADQEELMEAKVRLKIQEEELHRLHQQNTELRAENARLKQQR